MSPVNIHCQQFQQRHLLRAVRISTVSGKHGMWVAIRTRNASSLGLSAARDSSKDSTMVTTSTVRLNGK